MLIKGLKHTWEYSREPSPQAERLRSGLGCPSWVAAYLTGVGVRSREAALSWLDPRLGELPLPEDLPDLEEGVNRICAAIDRQELIAVYGDYDVDGFTATFVLSDFLRRSGARVVSYIPNRLVAGYGLHSASIRELRSQGAALLVTVDCGVANHEQVEEANRLGMDVVVTDHHLPSETLPSAAAVIDPKRLPSDHPLSNLAGVGVAFYVALALRSRLRAIGWYRSIDEPNLREYMDLLALGTVADMMPLQGVNRTLVRHGLHELAHGSRIALGALRQVIGHREEMVTPWDVHFRFAPRINAASRMGRQDVIMDWLSSTLMKDACDLALQMEDLNRKRVAIEEGVFREAIEGIERDDFHQTSQAIVLANRDWHAGILGIVASRIVERYRKPTILLTWKNDHWEGSGRSIDGFHLHNALKHCAGHLERFGGHAVAVGLKVSQESLQSFIRCFAECVKDQGADLLANEALPLHAAMPLSEINDATIAWMERLGPFGHGCAEPVFWAESVDILRRDVIREQHVRLLLGQNGKRFSAIAFRMAQQFPAALERLGACIFVPMRKTWAGQKGIQLRVLDCVSQNGP